LRPCADISIPRGSRARARPERESSDHDGSRSRQPARQPTNPISGKAHPHYQPFVITGGTGRPDQIPEIFGNVGRARIWTGPPD
jgi:hypothetical protein